MRIIEEKSDLVFQVGNWCETERKLKHAQRLIIFPGVQSYMNTTSEMREFAEHLNGTIGHVEKLHDVRIKEGDFEILVLRQG